MTKARGFHRIEPTDDELDIALVDLDDTLAYGTWHPKQTKSVIGEPIWENVDKLIRLYIDGMHIRIWTARPWAEENMIRAWFVHHDIPFHSILCGKPLCSVMIDDKARNAADVTWEAPSKARV